ncbi:hypothetical protein M0Q97_13745 [Candidatus Dojkabacteria bacterium]|jgi:hypothetical protein|nr:hypothetical protein [Candidatus Dojkabacteria bacterium]
MILTKEQTYQILFASAQRKGIAKRYKFTTKYKWKCLSCGCIIYISYKQYGRNSIFCDDCLKTNPKESIVQLQYIRKLKEEQLKLIENSIKFEI